MEVLRIVLSAVLALLLLSTGGGKLAGIESSRTIRDSLGIGAGSWKAIGAAEVLVVIGLLVGIWVVPVGLAATLGVIVLMVGAIAARVRAGGAQRRAGVAGDAAVLVVAVVAAVACAVGL
ncbi:DoxX family protein [Modestobacter altitudinis]|uniref:DoxX family protein n=1 Tax=Modestobacter altitudinis TaxID=2213158 RepID=UPI00110CC31B|nr:DoxX family protein [Modestobacter altitudinis]